MKFCELPKRWQKVVLDGEISAAQSVARMNGDDREITENDPGIIEQINAHDYEIVTEEVEPGVFLKSLEINSIY